MGPANLTVFLEMFSDDSDLIIFPSTIVQSDNNLEIVPARNCLVCGSIAESKHFNAIVRVFFVYSNNFYTLQCCNACGAFFRRSVSQAKRYVCQNGKQCQIIKKKSGHMCGYCRFRRCIQVGMSMSGK